MSDALVNSTGGSDNGFFGGFFSSVAEGFGQGLSRIGRDVLPVWTAQQLGLQQRDQLGIRGTVFVPVQQRIEDSGQGTPEDAGMLFDNFGITVGNVSLSGPAMLLIVGSVVLVALVAAR